MLKTPFVTGFFVNLHTISKKMIDIIKNNFLEARQVLDDFINNEYNWVSFEKAGNIMVEALLSNHTVFSCGNGGSMCDAMHFAEELSGRFRDDRPSLPAIAISDPSHITCVANDYGFDHIFSRFIEGFGKPGDVLLAISTSGNSKNVVNAAKVAQDKGMKIVALTGKTGGELASIADAELRIPDTAYSDRVQEIHIKIIHSLIQFIELNLKKP
jgi:D-sedoheptulose 7-phosphate isomerase